MTDDLFSRGKLQAALAERQTALPGLLRRCSSAQLKRPPTADAEALDFLRDSSDDLLSTSSGISGFFASAQPDAHGSLRHRGRAAPAETPRCLPSELRNFSAQFSDVSVSQFSLGAVSKRGIIDLPSDPFKILDVPGVEDDYYTNLLSWSAQNKIAVSLDNTVYLFDYNNAQIDTFYEAYKLEKVTSLAFDHFGDRLAIGNILGQVAIWDVERRKEVMCIERHTDRVSCLDWAEKGLLSGSKDKNVFMFDIRMRRHTANKFTGHTQEVIGVRWNSDCSRFASGGNDNRALAWELGSKAPTMTMKHKAGVKALCWSHTGRDILFTGGGLADRTIKAWNTARDKLLFSRETEGQVCALLHSQLTSDVISARGGNENEIEVWRANGLKRVGSLSGHTERPLYLAWSPEGDVLLSVSSDETMRFWQVYRTQRKSRNYDDFSSYECED